MKLKIWIVSTCIPEPGEGPCMPNVFPAEAAAEGYADKMMRGEWESAKPVEGPDGVPEPYPGDWRKAQERLVTYCGPTWGKWEITSHEIEVQHDAGIMLEALRAIVKTADDLNGGKEPDAEDYDDTESASSKGVDVGWWEAATVARIAIVAAARLTTPDVCQRFVDRVGSLTLTEEFADPENIELSGEADALQALIREAREIRQSL